MLRRVDRLPPPAPAAAQAAAEARLGQLRAAVDLLAGLSRGATTTWTADPPGHPGAEAVEVRARLLRSPPVAEAVAGLDAPSPA